MERLVKSMCKVEHCTSIIRGRNTQKRQGRESDHTSRHLEREGTTHEREGEAERSILLLLVAHTTREQTPH